MNTIFLPTWTPESLEEHAYDYMEKVEQYPEIDYDLIHNSLIKIYKDKGIFDKLNEQLEEFGFQIELPSKVERKFFVTNVKFLDNFSKSYLWENREKWRVPSYEGFSSFFDTDKQIREKLDTDLLHCLNTIAHTKIKVLLQEEKNWLAVYCAITENIFEYIK